MGLAEEPVECYADVPTRTWGRVNGERPIAAMENAMRHFVKNVLKRGADFYGLEREIQALRDEVQWLRERLDPKSRASGIYDLVRLDDISLFVPMYDNLYEYFIPDQNKRLTLERHREFEQAQTGPTDDQLRSDITKLLPLYLSILLRHGMPVHFLDIGAWVGDVAIRLGKFARQRGGKFFAECYDPSFAGTLIPFNIELNGVSEQVAFRPVGISLSGGPQIFSQVPGHSDSAKLGSSGGKGPAETYLIHTRTLAECLPSDHSSHVVVKIDVEGIDAKLVLQNLDRLHDATLMIEFAPSRDDSNEAYIEKVMQNHTLFDLYYLPRPTRAAPVGNAETFVAQIRDRPYGYTDILAVPHSLGAHDEIVEALARLKSLEPSNMMA